MRVAPGASASGGGAVAVASGSAPSAASASAPQADTSPPPLPPPPDSFVCPFDIQAGPLFAALWPGCTVDMAIGDLAARCADGHSCMRPCRIERTDERGTPDDSPQTFEYDVGGRLVKSAQRPPATTSTYEYDSAGRLVGGTDDGVPWKLQYDKAGRIARLETKYDETASFWMKYTYTRDGRLSRAVETSTRDKAPSWDALHTYGSTGQVESEVVNGERHLLGYDADRRLSVVKRDNWTYTYAYDASGRLAKTTDDVNAGSEATYEYDAKGRLSRTRSHRLDREPLITRFFYDCP